MKIILEYLQLKEMFFLLTLFCFLFFVYWFFITVVIPKLILFCFLNFMMKLCLC